MVADKKLTAIVSADETPASTRQAVNSVDGQQLPPGYVYDDEDGEQQPAKPSSLARLVRVRRLAVTLAPSCCLFQPRSVLPQRMRAPGGRPSAAASATACPHVSAGSHTGPIQLIPHGTRSRPSDPCACSFLLAPLRLCGNLLQLVPGGPLLRPVREPRQVQGGARRAAPPHPAAGEEGHRTMAALMVLLMVKPGGERCIRGRGREEGRLTTVRVMAAAAAGLLLGQHELQGQGGHLLDPDGRGAQRGRQVSPPRLLQYHDPCAY